MYGVHGYAIYACGESVQRLCERLVGDYVVCGMDGPDAGFGVGVDRRQTEATQWSAPGRAVSWRDSWRTREGWRRGVSRENCPQRFARMWVAALMSATALVEQCRLADA